jgi:hypothetical protein
MIASIKKQIETINEKYDIGLTPDNATLFDGMFYITTTKAAEMLHVGYLPFTITVRRWLVSAGVRSVSISRGKWYSFHDIEKILRESIEKNISVIEFCKLNRKVKNGERKRK